MNNYQTTAISAAIFLSSTVSLSSFAQEPNATIGNLSADKKEEIIEPEKKTESVHAAQIDTEKFELGLFIGALNVEEFNTNMVRGGSFTYHITPSILTQATYGSSTFDQALFESSSGGENARFLSEYKLSYASLLGGYKLLHGKSFLGTKTKMNSALYVMGGLGQVKFNTKTTTSFEFGVSYRVVVTDWLTMNLDFRDHIFERELDNTERTTNNTEVIIGLNALF